MGQALTDSTRFPPFPLSQDTWRPFDGAGGKDVRWNDASSQRNSLLALGPIPSAVTTKSNASRLMPTISRFQTRSHTRRNPAAGTPLSAGALLSYMRNRRPISRPRVVVLLKRYHRRAGHAGATGRHVSD